MNSISAIILILLSFELKAQFIFGTDPSDSLKKIVSYYNVKICSNPKLQLYNDTRNDSAYSILFSKKRNGFKLKVINYNEVSLISTIKDNKFSVQLYYSKYYGYLNDSTYNIEKLIYDSKDLKYEIILDNNVYKLVVKKYIGKARNELTLLSENVDNLVSTISSYILYNKNRCK
jgi:hypothetical protein